ncbi:ribonuclease H [Synechococcus sp. CS-1328]|uniref:ribonuclease H family protein n=1 Tax=Synechococcus sp. CS-1328 TaxID=2847976 RepID=UPI00223B663A|nr:ribonuclease H [Synechococcus sp. CS-1328]MCT0223714.1 ribonuclease HI [Synechococcus sp. CS-1328]
MAAETVRVVAAACDGACSGNPGPGGWGALLRFSDGSVRELGGADRATTNNRMELTAALALLEALAELPHQEGMAIRTDSRYLIDGLDKWMAGWKRKGWRTASGNPVLNRDLWEALDRARLPGVRLAHVRGHSGDPDNERCDAIAVAFSKGRTPPPLKGEQVQELMMSATVPAGSAPVPAGRAAVPVVKGKTPTGAKESSVVSDPLASADPGLLDDPAPPALQQLLGRLELADRLAAGGYGLSLVELAQLVEMPLSTLQRRQQAWQWRDWQVLPLADGRWRLERGAAGSPQRDATAVES